MHFPSTKTPLSYNLTNERSDLFHLNDVKSAQRGSRDFWNLFKDHLSARVGISDSVGHSGAHSSVQSFCGGQSGGPWRNQRGLLSAELLCPHWDQRRWRPAQHELRFITTHSNAAYLLPEHFLLAEIFLHSFPSRFIPLMLQNFQRNIFQLIHH